MRNLSFKEGMQSFMINDDPSRIIHFNPADPNLVPRLLDLEQEFTNYHPEHDLGLNADGSHKSGLEKDAAYIQEFTTAMRAAINKVFNADIYDTIFNGQSPLCIVEGRYLFEEVLDSMTGILSEEINIYNKKNKEKMAKYLKDVKK